MIALGVAAEVIFSIFSHKRSKKLERISDEKVAASEKLAAEAMRTAEHEKLERVRLEADLSPRFFKNQDKAIERLRSFKGTPVVLSYPLDWECHQTAEQIAFVLTAAGWLLTPRPNTDRNPLLSRGVIVDGPKAFPLPIQFGSAPQAAGSSLVEELNKTDIDANFPPGVSGSRPEVFVHVGMRLSPQEKAMHRLTDAMHQAILEGMSTGTPPDLKPLTRALSDEMAALGPGEHGGRFQLPRN